MEVERPPGTVDPSTHAFKIPTRGVTNPDEIQVWEKSQAYNDVIGFLQMMNDACKNTKTTEECHISKVTRALVDLLDTLESWIDDIPPIDQPQRFGNKAFRDWYDRLKERACEMLSACLDEPYGRAASEISVYLVESFGNSTRIDYGTGHELAFAAFLCCLYRVGAFRQEDAPAVVNKVFAKYMCVSRKLQIAYRMEPAGSQGVWSLDDYHFIPFIWGSSQLLDHPRLKPKSFPNVDICDAYAKDYLFLSCIQYIHQVKQGPFAEHSNQLWNVSGVALWSKVNSGLFKMYKAEVLNKYPIIQHFLFGSLLTTEPAVS